MKKLILYILFSLNCIIVFALDRDYGVYIKSYPSLGSEYSSILLNEGKPININDSEITLSFKLQVRPEHVFGTVFRIITDTDTNIDLMFSVGKKDNRFPILVIGEEIYPINTDIVAGKWVSVKLKLNINIGKLLFSYDESNITLTKEALTETNSILTSFGYCPYENHTLVDAASINIKDIELSNSQKKLYFWRLEKHNHEICYDEIQGARAVVINPKWIIDDYISWKKIYEGEFTSSPSIAYNSNDSKFYIANNNKNLYILDTENKTCDTINVITGEYAANFPNQLVYITQTDRLLSYNLNENLFSFFDFKNHKWSNHIKPQSDHDYWNNTTSYNPIDSTLICFGGYGHYLYNNKMTVLYPNENRTAIYNLPLIDPRFSCSSIIVNDTLYIFGGRGCHSGRQELSPKNYYDFYAIDLKTRQTTKIFEIPQEKINNDFLPSDNMVYNKKTKSFYAFTSINGGTLIRFDIENASYEKMSLPIEEMNKEFSYYYNNLYYYHKSNKLFVSFVYTVKSKKRVSIYEMQFPEMAIDKLTQSIQKSKSHKNYWYILLAIIPAFCIILILRNKAKGKKRINIENENKTEIIDTDNIENAYDITTQNSKLYSKSSICFLGGFHAFDKEGNDITSLFTPVLKNLTILLILYTTKNNEGISVNKLIQILWADKSEKSAQNNRNVYLSKLRSILEKLGNVTILNHNSYINILFQEHTHCDYIDAVRLFNDIENEENIEKLIELLLYGPLLPDVENEWIDSFKNNFSNMTIDLLTQLLKKNNVPDNMKLKIAETLFQHDYLNEEALKMKCYILYKQGKTGIAKSIYDTFCKEYYHSIGTEYDVPLKDLISKLL